MTVIVNTSLLFVFICFFRDKHCHGCSSVFEEQLLCIASLYRLRGGFIRIPHLPE
ncbi:hypothetical protein [Lucifera butyrica]|uniref:hypothetical protein n=1 Tax=Lucifera butyrica TaxID=1351585 RepID=UPI001401E01E|nr:hypothetical protein [Lucifera butyrica]